MLITCWYCIATGGGSVVRVCPHCKICYLVCADSMQLYAGVVSSACTPFSREAERFSLAGMHASARLSIFPMMHKINTHFLEVPPVGGATSGWWWCSVLCEGTQCGELRLYAMCHAHQPDHQADFLARILCCTAGCSSWCGHARCHMSRLRHGVL